MAVQPNDIILVSFRGTQSGQRIILTQTYRCISSGDGSTTYVEDMSNIIGVLSATGGMRDKYLACLASSYTLNEIRAQVIKPVRQVFVGVTQVSKVGTNTGSGNVTNMAAAITLRTMLSGRGFIANKHIGPIPSDAPSAGVLDATYQLSLSNLKDTLIAQVVPAGFDVPSYQPCIYHRAGATPATRSTDITSGIVQTTSRVQRRRTVGQGE